MIVAPTAPRVDNTYRPATRLDLGRTVGFFRRGGADPTQTSRHGTLWRATRTPQGTALLALRQAADGTVHSAAWGDGRHWVTAQMPRLCGRDDDRTDFDPSHHRVIADSDHRHPGLRLGCTDMFFDSFVQSVLEQKVTAVQAFRAWSWLVTRFGDHVPGPSPVMMYAPPSIDGWMRIPSWAWHRAGVEPPQSRTIVRAARRGASLVRAMERADSDNERDRILLTVVGIGPWTSAEARIRAFGARDAVSFGDYHLAHQVGFALTGARTDDEGMMRLLEPWRGQRQRVLRLIAASGVREPRRAARLHPQDHRRH